MVRSDGVFSSSLRELVSTEYMTRHQYAFIVIVCLALLWAIARSLEPSGGSIPWFLGFLFLALLNYYYGFVDRGYNPIRFHAQAGFVTFLALALLMAYIARVEDDGLSEIAEYISVYPRIEELHLIPRTSGNIIQHWQIKTSDSVEDIRKYYSDLKNLGDWEIIRNKPVLVFDKNNMRLTITVGEQPRSPLTFAFYRLEYK